MNKFLKKIDQERVLFFDIEDVRRSKELDINSREFDLFRKKTRNRDTDEFLPDDEVIAEYKKRAALKMCYTTIVSIGVGFIKEGQVHIKALGGTEEEIIKQFCTIAQNFDYVAGANVIAFDLPMICNNGFRYFDVSTVLPDRFITSGKKPWGLESVIDTQEIFKGTHYYPNSLDEVCYHFGLPSPKSDLDGSMVSDEYWDNGLDKINAYVKQDVFAVVNVFKKMRFEEAFDSFIDKNNKQEKTSFVEQDPVLNRLFNTKEFTQEIKDEIALRFYEKYVAIEEYEMLRKMLKDLYVNNKMFESDSPAIVAAKKIEVDEFVDTLMIINQ